MTSLPTSIVSVSAGSAVPIYRQLIEQIERLVAAGQLAAGDTLPSVRELAEHLAVNPMTISKAYSQLEAQGVLERRRGLGMAVAASAVARNKPDRLERLRPTLERAAVEARQLEIDTASALALFQRLLRKK